MARGNSKKDTGAKLGFEAKLWQAADATPEWERTR